MSAVIEVLLLFLFLIRLLLLLLLRWSMKKLNWKKKQKKKKKRHNNRRLIQLVIFDLFWGVWRIDYTQEGDAEWMYPSDRFRNRNSATHPKVPTQFRTNAAANYYIFFFFKMGIPLQPLLTGCIWLVVSFCCFRMRILAGFRNWTLDWRLTPRPTL